MIIHKVINNSMCNETRLDYAHVKWRKLCIMFIRNIDQSNSLCNEIRLDYMCLTDEKLHQ